MPNEISVRLPQNNKESSKQPSMNAAIGRFNNLADVEKAIKALEQAGFTAEAISVRDLATEESDNKKQVGSITTTMVGVEAEGKKAAEAWSILRHVHMESVPDG